MDKAAVQTLISLIPIAIDLTTKLLSFAEAAKKDGYDVPTIDELRALNDKLKELPDL